MVNEEKKTEKKIEIKSISIEKKVEELNVEKKIENKPISIKKKVEEFESLKRSGVIGKALLNRFNKEDMAEIYAYYSDRDSKLVRGKFRYLESPGGTAQFFYRKWPKDQIKEYIMRDGMIYVIPVGVAKHINKNCATPVHEYVIEKSLDMPTVNMVATPPRGNEVKGLKIVDKKNRLEFISTDFTDDMELFGAQQEKRLVTVERF